MIYNLKRDEHTEAVRSLQANTGYCFRDESVLMEALRHPSYSTEFPQLGKNNQRLEFLGDAVLELVLTKHLYNMFPEYNEGMLTKTRAFLANETATADYARRLKLDRLLLLGRGEDASDGRSKPSILGDLYEAFLGAVYLDGGYAEAEKICLSLLPAKEDIITRTQQEENPKGALQELCQEHRLGIPEYEIISRTGPVHKPQFGMRVVLNGRELARTTASKQKEAERTLAKEALKILLPKISGTPERKIVVALDFDGVICNSARETGMSGWKAAKRIWPDLFPKSKPTKANIDAFCRVRPYLETGYHAILLTKMLQEKLSFEEIAANHNAHYERIIRENNLDKSELIRIFGEVRDNWIQTNLDEWLAVHDFFDGVLDALNNLLRSNCRAYIITTKQERFVLAALRSRGVNFPEEYLFGLDRKKKKEEHLLDILKDSPAEVHFVEDRLETLQRIEKVDGLNSVKLHYATWGYGTAQDDKDAAADPRLTLHTIQDFNRWLSGMDAY